MFAYLDCGSGISGDMFLGALLDAGAPAGEIEKAVRALKLRGVGIVTRKEKRGAIVATRVIVNVPRRSIERDYKSIVSLISGSSLAAGVKDRALRVFKFLAAAEAKIHGSEIDHVHFHEVGAVDSIVDIVGGAALMEFLGISEVACSAVALGSGTIKTSHGLLPLPAPATVELLAGLTAYGSGVEGELTTPTGAAILRAFATECGPLPAMTIKKVGYGAGSKTFPDRPNTLRVILGERVFQVTRDKAVVIEANVDDMVPQDFEVLMDALFEAGAMDVSLVPIHMKKNRPGVLVQALAPESAAGAAKLAMFRNSSTIGLRSYPVDRVILKRSEVVAKTILGDISYKKVTLPDGAVRITPEYEDLKAAAKKAGVGMEIARRTFWAAMGKVKR